MPYIIHALLYYELSLAAGVAPSQLCLQDKACSGSSYMMEYYTERVQQGASEASHPVCNNNIVVCLGVTCQIILLSQQFSVASSFA